MKTTVWHERSALTGSYSVRFYDPIDGKKKRVLCGSYEEMKAEKNRLEKLLMDHKLNRIPSGRHPLNVLDKYFEAIKYTHRASTIELKKYALKDFLSRFTEFEDMTSIVIESWRTEMEAKYKSDTVALRLRELRALINWARKAKLTAINPFETVKIPASSFVGRKVDNNELGLIYGKMNDELRPLISFILETGCRRGEILGMVKSELDMNNKTWTIPVLRSKTKRARTIPLTPKALACVLNRPGIGERIWGDWTKERLHKAWKKALAAAKIDGRVRIHDLRHTFASNWRGRGATLKAVCGWKTDAMMGHYTHVDTQDIREDMNKNQGFGVDLGHIGSEEGK